MEAIYLESGETELEDGTVENTKYVATEASNYIVLIDDALWNIDWITERRLQLQPVDYIHTCIFTNIHTYIHMYLNTGLWGALWPKPCGASGAARSPSELLHKMPYIHTGPCGGALRRPPCGPSRRCVSSQLRAYIHWTDGASQESAKR